MSITVYKSPDADFTYTGDPTGCVPVNLTFHDNSTLGDASITSWAWDFDDGSFPSSDPTQVHSFVLQGNYSVKLVVEDANGCRDNITIEDLVKASNLPVINFSANPAHACNPPLTAGFINNSTGVGALTYSWDFGDGSGETSALAAPSHTYTQQGQYQVGLTVTDENGCSNTSVRPLISISPVSASFKVYKNDSVIGDNSIVCPGKVCFKNTSVGVVNCKWLFGDGGITFGDSVTHNYYTAGNYTITFIAEPTSPCSDTAYFHITVETAHPNFTMNPDPAYSCKVPYIVHATNLTAAGEDFYWGSQVSTIDSSDMQHPSFTFLTEGNHSIILTAVSAHGCKAYMVKTVLIKLPIADFIVNSRTHGCVPLQVSFTDSSKSLEPVISWNWVFGNGTTSSQQNPTNIYNTAGDFTTYLIIENSLGCRDTSDTIMVHPGIAPHPGFTVSPASLCIGDTLYFTDLTPASDNADEWHYDVEGHHLSHCIFSPDQAMPVDTTGALDVTLTAGYNECYATYTIPDAVNVKGPMVNFSYNSDCAVTGVYNFTGTILGAENFIWDFGDGGSDSVNHSPSHTYSASQDFTIGLSATNTTAGCSCSVSKTIKNRSLAVDFLTDNSGDDTVIVCAKSPTAFLSTSIDVLAECHEGYYWNFGDNTPYDFSDSPNSQHTYMSAGLYKVRHWAVDANGCRDTVVKHVKIFNLDAAFTTNVTGGCTPLHVIAANTSVSDTNITNITWNWGDGTPATSTNEHIYTGTGNFTITQTVYDTLSCSDNFSITVHPANPNAVFSMSPVPAICAGDSIKFTRYYLSADSVAWDFGDGIQSDNPASSLWHTYQDSGIYSVALTVYKNGCMVDSLVNNCINVQFVTADFTITLVDTTDNINCYPLELKYQYNVIPNHIVSWYWNSGAGGQSVNSDSVRFIYNRPGHYFVTLDVTTQNGCHARDSVPIQVKGPYADFTVSPDTICKGDMVSFSMFNPSNVYSFEWDFGDGNPGSGTTTSHRYYLTGTVHPILLLRVDSVHSCDVSLFDTVYIHQVISGFDVKNNDVPDTSGCAVFHAQMDNQSSGPGLTYNWQIDHALQSVAADPLFDVSQPGTHLITLLVTSSIGCTDTSMQEIIVYPVPVVLVNNDTAICSGDSIHFFSTGGSQYSWSPPTGLSDPFVSNPWAKPLSSVNYTVVVTDTNNCSSNAGINIIVQPKPSVELRDTTLIIGESMTIDVDPVENINYHWEPPAGLSCVDCPGPYVFTLDSMVYYVTLTDNYGCFTIRDSIIINIREAYSFNVPLAFTPNGDSRNERAYVRGWGIKELREFKIFNRWGQLVYSSNDLHEGWDGCYNGKAQNIDTYIYHVTVEFWNGSNETKKGYITIIK